MKNEISYEQLKQELEQKLYNINDKNKNRFILIDVRTPEEYNGEFVKSGSVYGGHIKGAMLLPHFQLMNKEGGFKDKKELQDILKDKNINPDDDIIVYCHSGQRSEIVAFALTNILKYPNVRNFVGSWIEWSNKEQNQSD